jgi:hypothetical protein
VPSDSKPSEGLPLMNTSVNAGKKNQSALQSIHAITLWD